jgi:YidC/Oxa1 family membrane protein insertase
MNTEVRFLLAIGLMLLVLVGTNLLFPPIQEPDPAAVDSTLVTGGEGEGLAESGDEIPEELRTSVDEPEEPPAVPVLPGQEDEPSLAAEPEGPSEAGLPAPPPEQRVAVESPLYRFEFSSHGARLLSAELLQFRSLRRDGPVQLVPEDAGAALGTRLVVRGDTVDLRGLAFRVEPAVGLTLEEEGPTQELRFVFEHPTRDFAVELAYTFDPSSYLVEVEGSVEGVDRALVLTDLGTGLAYNEADSAAEARMMAWVENHLDEGIDSHELSDVDERRIHEGPFLWAAFKSKFFVLAVMPAGEGDQNYLGGVIAEPYDGGARLTVARNLGADGRWAQVLFVGPQDYARLSAIGTELEEVNPYGWRFLRPVLRPIVAGIIWVLNFLHNSLNLGYGWVLILFGILMRVVLWPFNQKAMRAQMRNMQVQPLLKEIQEKYKDNPERLQKEMMRLYKEYGFNPLAGCLPMLLPWPVLIALFFVFQNTIELRGVEFLWLPDLSAKDPFYILPLFLAVSMFALQFISYRSMEQDNPQMKMMLWFMPFFMGFIFMQFASGLNLYYATANIATIPQQFWIAKERERAKGKGPVKLDDQG